LDLVVLLGLPYTTTDNSSLNKTELSSIGFYFQWQNGSKRQTKGYVEDWTYEGPRRVAVYIYKDTNLLAWNHSYQQLSDKNDPDLQKQQWEDLEIHAGLDKYPVELTFEKDPVLISAMVQLEVLQEDIPLQKEYYWDG
jgi:hypothetical protein